MKRFTDAGRRANADGNLYAALTLALTIPDICGSLEAPGDGVRKRYERWCNQWLVSKFAANMSATECYRLRCSLVHSGQVDIASDGRPFRFEFYDRDMSSHLGRFDCNDVHGVKADFLVLRADLFSESVFQAADDWDVAVQSDAAIQAEKAKLLVIRAKGYQPLQGMKIS